MDRVNPHACSDLSTSAGPGDPNAGTILALSAASKYDFRLTGCPADKMRDRFPEWVSYYRMKWAIARALQPRSILEIGVRYGYSAAAFLDACPHAGYLGIDIDSDEFGGTKGAIEWARKITESYSAKFLVADSQKLSELPGDRYDLIHVDGQQDGDGSFHDLQLAIRQGGFVLADGFFWTPENFYAISEFLKAHRDLIDYYLVIPGYAGELLIKPRPSTASTSGTRQVNRSEDLRRSYTSEYYLQDCGGYVEYRQTGGKALRDDRLLAVASLATLKTYGRVLDLGCGRGELAYYFAEQGFQVTAVDYSADAIQLAERTFAGEAVLRSRVKLCHANLAEVPLSGSYDMVVAADVIEHLTATELDEMYAKIARHLTLNGIFIVHTYPNLWYFQYDYARKRRVASSVGAYLSKEPRTRYESLMHINEQSPRVLKRQLAKHFPNVLLWFGEPGNTGGSLLRKYSHRDLAAARDLWAIACHSPIDEVSVRSRLESNPLPSAQLGVLKMSIIMAPSEVRADENFVASVEVFNRSAFVLGSMLPAPVHISYHWLSGDAGTEVVRDGLRTLIRPPLAPGVKRRFEASIVAPSLPGTYVLKLTLVQENVQWFDVAPTHLASQVVVQVAPKSAFQTGTIVS